MLRRLASTRLAVRGCGRTTPPRLATTTAADPGAAATPGEADLQRFDCDSSVGFWHAFSWEALVKEHGSDQQAFRHLASQVLAKEARSDPQYWAGAGLRTTLFASQGALSLLAFGVSRSLARLFQSDSAATSGAANEAGAPLLNRLTRQPFEAVGRARESAPRLLAEALLAYRQDFHNIKRGRYIDPFDMQPGHHQWQPGHMARAHVRFMREALATLDRRHRSGVHPSPTVGTAPTDPPAQPVDTSVWLGGAQSMYPPYYLNTYHFQTDGWLSSESAAVYETSTETLFVGRQDAMQRHALVPLSAHLADKNPRHPGAADAPPLTLLELGCGTGRFHTFIKDNFPWLHTTALDLSPFYLEQARANDKRWRVQRRQRAVDAPPTRFVHAAAENVPLADASMDCVVCVYMLHEMPSDARAALAREAARVLKPGGVMVVADSIQLGDRPASDKGLGAFSGFNEPFYESYIREDLGRLFGEAGLEPGTKLLASSTKVLSFNKPKAVA